MEKKTIQLPHYLKVRQVFEEYLITQCETNGGYEIYSLKTCSRILLPFLPSDVRWKELECKKNIGCIFTAYPLKAKNGEKVQCLLLAHEEKLLTGKYGNDIFDSIEVIGNKIHTTVILENKEYLEQWFNEQGELLLYAEKAEGEVLYTVYAVNENSFSVSRKAQEVQKVESVLDENGNVRGVVITQCKENGSNTGYPIMYYNFTE